jgi:ATP-dependent helicase/nuclease subunit A
VTSPVDAAERERAIRTFDANVVVTAGAGTGKTTLLVERLVHLVVREPEPVPVTEIVALTFTNMAAAELIVRFRERLQALADAADGSVEAAAATEVGDQVAALVSWTRTSTTVVGARLRAALIDLDRSHIGTLHAFAATLLRLFPIEAGVDPRFREADEAARGDHVAEAWDAWLQRELGRDAPRAAVWKRLLDRVTLDELVEPARGLSVESVPLEAIGELAAFPPQAGAWLAAAREEARRLLEVHPQQRVIEQRLAAAEHVFAASVDGRAIDIAASEAVANDVRSAPKGWDSAEAARAKELIRLARRLCAVDGQTVVLLGEVLAPFVRECRAAFAQAGWVPFDGLLARARDLVRDHPGVREALKRRFRALLVDECQDTDPMQYEILCFLAEAPGTSAVDWRSVRLAPGKLFMVGDPKQSIYGFRGADLEAYQDVVRTVLAQGGVECTLTTNFRSRGAILDAVNAVGTRLLVHRPGLQAAYKPIAPASGASGGAKPIIRIVRARGGTFDAADAREAEADNLAQWLTQSVFGALTIRNGQGGGKRAEPGDVAVLLRALTDVHVYLEGLRRHGIPYVVEGERRFFAAPEVVDAINVLRTLASPYDAVALAGVLRSPLGAVTDRELYELSRSGWLDYRVIETDDPPGPWAPTTLYRALSDLSQDIPRLPVDEAVTAVFDRLPLHVLAAGGPYGDQAAANLDKLERIARELALEGLSFPALVARLDHRVRDEVEEAESPLVDEAVNAVKVLSVHKAKGLEFPIVVLAAAHGGRRSGPRPAVLKHWSSGVVGVRVGDVASLAGVYLSEQLARREAEESRRLLYVAMTRARDLLVVSGAEIGRGPAPDGPAALITDALETPWGPAPPGGSAAAAVFDWQVVEAEPGRGAVVCPPAVSLAWPDRDTFASVWETRAARAERITGAPMFVTPTGLAARAGAARVARTSVTSGAGVRARQIGTLIHAFLQGWDYGADVARWPAEVDAFIAAQRDEDLAVTTDDLREVLAPFFSSVLYQELATARVLGREVPLIMPWEDAIIEGVIDLIYERDGRLYVADYKTDAVDAAAARTAAERYRVQGEVYGRAVREGLGREVDAFRCLFLRPAVAIDLPVLGRD